MANGEADACEDPSKRQFLISAAALAAIPGALLPVLGSKAEAGVTVSKFSSLAARFVIPGAGKIYFNFQDASNFSLSADAGPGSTIALRERIYVYIAPSITSFGGSGRLLLTGELASLANRSPTAGISIRPAPAAQAAARRWKVPPPLMQVVWPASLPDFTAGTLTVARLPELAAAQLAVSRRLRRGMNMAMCGDAIGRLIASWPETVTARGLAVLAHSQGIELAGDIGPLRSKVALPANLPIEDYRLSR